MRNRDRRWWGLAVCGLLGCSGLADGEDGPAPSLGACSLDADCPAGLLCAAPVCVRPDDGLPPEIPDPIPAGRPAVSPNHLFVLAPDADAVLALTAETLEVTRIPLEGPPLAVAALADRDAAVVLGARWVALVEVGADGPRVRSAALARRYARVTLAPDGAWAGLSAPADEAADGIVALLDLAALAADEPAPLRELAVGFRPTDLLFRNLAGTTVGVSVVAKDAVTHLDLRLADARAARLLLPDAFREVFGRRVLAPPGEGPLVLSSPTAPVLGLVDVATGTVSTVALGGVATDVALTPDGRRVVVALRGERSLLVAPLPEVATTTAALARYPVASTRPGLVTLTPDGETALVYSRVDDSERLAAIDLRTGAERAFDRLQKQVRDVVVGPQGRSAVVVHQADPDSGAADPIERAVDQAEGYALLDLESGFAQLVRTGTRAPSRVVFGASGDFAAVTVVDPQQGLHRIDVLDFATLVTESLPLPSRPRHAGVLPGSERVWVAQDHAAGRLGVVDLPTASQRTLSGLLLDAALEEGADR